MRLLPFLTLKPQACLASPLPALLGGGFGGGFGSAGGFGSGSSGSGGGGGFCGGGDKDPKQFLLSLLADELDEDDSC